MFLHFHIVRAHRSPHSLLFRPSLSPRTFHVLVFSKHRRTHQYRPRIPNSVPFCTIMLPHSPLLLSSAVNTPRSHLSSNIPVVPVGRLFHCFTLIIPSRFNSLPSSLLRSQPNSRYPLTLDIPHPHSLYSLLHLTFPHFPHFLIYSVSLTFSHASLLKRISQNTALSIVFHSSTLSLAIVILLFSIHSFVFTWLSLSL